MSKHLLSHVVVVGAGIVGLAVAHHLLERDYSVTIFDPNEPGSQTSSGNAGGIGTTEIVPHVTLGMIRQIPGWLIDPLGPVHLRWRHLPNMWRWLFDALAASRASNVRAIATAQHVLLEQTYNDLEKMLAHIGLSHVLHRRGALTVYKTEHGFAMENAAWSMRTEFGIPWNKVSRKQIHEFEPDLGDCFDVGVYTPDWGHVDDPFEIAKGLAMYCRKQGAKVVRSKVTACDAARNMIYTTDGEAVSYDHVVVAAGVWSKPLVAQLGWNVPLESERGYNVTLPAPGVSFNNEVIFGDMKFVATPLTLGLRIGGAAEFAGINSPPNYARSDAMLQLAAKVIPGLNPSGATQWMGHRPTLPDTLPVIGRSPEHGNVYFAFGHSHLGLTQAATTGRLISMMVAGEPLGMDMEPYGIQRFYKRS